MTTATPRKGTGLLRMRYPSVISFFKRIVDFEYDLATPRRSDGPEV